MVIGMERNGRIPEVMDRMQPVMEAYFREACIFFQQTVDCSGEKIWENVKSAVGEALQKAVSLQKEGRKGKLQYLCFSFMEYGRLKAIPMQRKKERIILEEIAKDIQEGITYSEKEITDIITKYHEDYCTIRRDMISERILERQGSTYRKCPPAGL